MIAMRSNRPFLPFLTVAAVIALLAGGCSDNGRQAAADAAVADGALSTFEKCFRDCNDMYPAGKTLSDQWNACVDKACSALPVGSDEWTACQIAAVGPDNPTAACRTETQACFSGTIAGCKELAALVEKDCEPETLPIPDELALGQALWCVMEHGWRATPGAQAIAWPLFQCVFADPPAGCIPDCMGGAAACRACAEVQCKDLYAACMADTADPVVDDPPAADMRACQEITTCVNWNCLL